VNREVEVVAVAPEDSVRDGLAAVEPEPHANLAELVHVLVHPPGEVAYVRRGERPSRLPDGCDERLHATQVGLGGVLASGDGHGGGL